MLYLIEYDREKGRLVEMRSFRDEDFDNAAASRLELELRLQQHRLPHEVVLLQAPTEVDLRTTHRRYFVGIAELATSSGR